jgi:integrase
MSALHSESPEHALCLIDASPAEAPTAATIERSPAFQVLPHVMSTGERFPVLVRASTGIPPRLPLRYAFARRRLGGPEKLRSSLRSLAPLYAWYERVLGIDLDEHLLAERPINTAHLERALRDVAGSRAAARGAPESSVGSDGERLAPFSPRSHNRRVAVWEDFLLWTLQPKNWVSAGGDREFSSVRVEAQRQAREELIAFFSHTRMPAGQCGRRKGLTQAELEVVEAAIGPDENGSYRSVGFAPECRFRNWLMYQTARWLGLRRGELLKLKVEDLPQEGSEEGEIAVVRRPDDIEDPRVARTPSVKRGDRRVAAPDELLSDLRRYIEHDRKGPARGYLFVSRDGSPLSVDRADDIIRQTGRYAATLFEATYPGRAHSLWSLTWHRLRHTRAAETLPDFLAAGATGMDEFLMYFGWASSESAQPYVSDVHRSRASARLRALYQRDVPGHIWRKHR